MRQFMNMNMLLCLPWILEKIKTSVGNKKENSEVVKAEYSCNIDLSSILE